MPLELLSDWPGEYSKGAIQIRNLAKKLEDCVGAYARSCLMVDFKHDVLQIYSAKNGHMEHGLSTVNLLGKLLQRGHMLAMSHQHLRLR